MNYFFITEREGLLPAHEFSEHLRSRWPEASVREVLDLGDNHALEFSITMTYARLEGSLNRKGDSLAFIGDFRDCAAFALWCQGLLPPGESATFCDEGMSGDIELSGSTSLDDVLHAFGEQL
jgi:hypothetical protein